MKTIEKMMKRTIIMTIVVLLVAGSGFVMKASAANTVSAKFYVLKSMYERPSELPITSNPQNHYEAGLPGTVLLKDPDTGKSAAYLSYLHGYVGDVTKFLVDVPSDEDIERVVPEFDPDVHYIQWYVVKGESEGVNVDGVIVLKDGGLVPEDEPQETVFDDSEVVEEVEEVEESVVESVDILDEDTPLKDGLDSEGKCFIHLILIIFGILFVVYEVIALVLRKLTNGVTAIKIADVFASLAIIATMVICSFFWGCKIDTIVTIVGAVVTVLATVVKVVEYIIISKAAQTYNP